MNAWFRFTKKWLRIGALGFGGPGVQISFMLEQFVKREKSISDETFSEGLAIASTLPGPEAQQLATFLGFKEKGFLGGMISGSCFVLPGLILITLAAIGMHHLDRSALPALYPLKVAATALIFHSVSKLAMKQLKSKSSWALFVLAISAALFGIDMSQIIFASFLLAVLLTLKRFFFKHRKFEVKGTSWAGDEAHSEHDHEGESKGKLEGNPKTKRNNFRQGWPIFASIGVFILMISLYVSLSGDFKRVAFDSLKATLLSFGGAYAALPILADSAYHQLESPEMFYSGIAFAELLPGPLMLMSSWLGALICASQPHPVTSAALGSLTAAVFTFLPGMLLMMSLAQIVGLSQKFLKSLKGVVLPVALAGMILIGFRLINNVSHEWNIIHPAILVSIFLVLLGLGLSTLRVVGIALILTFFLYGYRVS